MYPDEVLLLFLPKASFSSSRKQRKPLRDRSVVLHDEAVNTELSTEGTDEQDEEDSKMKQDVSTQTCDINEVEECVTL